VRTVYGADVLAYHGSRSFCSETASLPSGASILVAGPRPGRHLPRPPLAQRRTTAAASRRPWRSVSVSSTRGRATASSSHAAPQPTWQPSCSGP